MILKEKSKYKIITNDTIVEITLLHYQNDVKVCFYGNIKAKDGTLVENPREYHLNLEMLKHWREL